METQIEHLLMTTEMSYEEIAADLGVAIMYVVDIADNLGEGE